MRVFMLGWEFPPYISGGLGTACEGLTRALAQGGTEIAFVLPRPIDTAHRSHVKLLSPSQTTIHAEELSPSLPKKIRFHTVPTAIRSPYATTGSSTTTPTTLTAHPHAKPPTAHPLDPPATARYEGDLIAEAQRYAKLCLELAHTEPFDVVHAHDWLTFPAAMAVAEATGRPFVAHVHSTEFDRGGEHHIQQNIFEIERRGMHAATRVIAVSHLTRRILEARYDLPPHKINVIYNGTPPGSAPGSFANRSGSVKTASDEAASPSVIRVTDKIVLFLGRITMQKGPEYFIEAARQVLEVMDNVKFVMAGAGDKVAEVIELAARHGIAGKVLFTGFLHSGDVHRVFDLADVFVMPSVSEPFGLVVLEAISHEVPVILSKQSGVSEVVQHALKVDFWDTREMANKIIAVLRHPPLARTLTQEADIEVQSLTWDDTAAKCVKVYEHAQKQVAESVACSIKP